MKIDPITQLILEADVQGARDAANRVGSAMATGAKNKAIKAGGYVASKYTAKFGKKLTHAKCQQLHDIALKHQKAGGRCNGAKFEYYKQLTFICNDGHRLQTIFTHLNTKLMRPKTKKAKQEEAQRMKTRILGAKEKLQIAKELIDKKCRDEAERSLEDRAKKQERAKAKAKAAAKRKSIKKRLGA